MAMLFKRFQFNRYRQIPGVEIYQPTKISGIQNIEFGTNVIIDCFSYIYAIKKIKIGNNVHIASHMFIGGGDEIEIGDFAGFFHGAKIYATTDDFKHWGFGNPMIDEKYRNLYRAPVKIGRFTIIGANCVILPGVSIGEGASVGACSVVTKDLEPWGIYIGNKKIGERDRDAVLETHDKFLQEKN